MANIKQKISDKLRNNSEVYWTLEETIKEIHLKAKIGAVHELDLAKFTTPKGNLVHKNLFDFLDENQSAQLRSYLKSEKHVGPVKDIIRRVLSNKVALGFSISFAIFLLLIISAPIWLNESDGLISNKFESELPMGSSGHIMGTDTSGRDYLTRIVFGARLSMTISVIAIFSAASVGIALGVIAGFFGGWSDTIIMRMIDVILSIPGLLLAMAIATSLGQNVVSLIVALAFGRIASYARVIRAQVLSLKHHEFIEASHLIGASKPRIMILHLIPNSLGPVIVQMTIGLATVILSTAGLAFLGIGITAPTPELGGLISDARNTISRPEVFHLLLIPGLIIMYIILTINIIGDALRDALDPKLRD